MKAKGVHVVYEPALKQSEFFVFRLKQTLPASVGLIVANRITDEIRDVAHKVYSRDLFGGD